MPLLILLAVGLLLTLFYVFWVGARIHRTYPFEKSIFTWGWFTGTMAMGIALLRITDPESKSGCLDDYAFAYLYIAPVEIALVSLSPLAFAYGLGWLFVGLCALLGIGMVAIAPAKDVEDIMQHFAAHGESPFLIGHSLPGDQIREAKQEKWSTGQLNWFHL